MMGVRPRQPRGIAALEFALVVPLLCLLLMGMIDWGYYLYTEQVVVNAAREGARAGSLQAANDATALTNATTRARACLTGLKNPSTATVTAAMGTGNASVIVNISYPTGSLTGFTKVVVPGAAKASAEMRRWSP